MESFVELLRDNTSLAGRLFTSALVTALAVVLVVILSRYVPRRTTDPYHRYYLRKAVRIAVVVVLLVALAVVWRPFAVRIVVVLGLFAAGVAFAMQEVIGALAGWTRILTGGLFRVEMAGVRGDGLDVTALRTRLLEIGSDRAGAAPPARQYTGRGVSISNKAIFSQPVYNSTADLEYLWEELTVPVRHGDDWRLAVRLLEAGAWRASASDDVRAAIEEMRRRYPVARNEVVQAGVRRSLSLT